jgi:hypothetical protein
MPQNLRNALPALSMLGLTIALYALAYAQLLRFSSL